MVKGFFAKHLPSTVAPGATLEPCRCSPRSSPWPLEDKWPRPTPPAPLSRSPAPRSSPYPRFPDRARALASPQDRRRPAAVLHASPSIPATSGQAEATTSSAVFSSPSLLRESSRDGLVPRRRPRFLHRRPELRRDAAVDSEPLRPRRGYPRNQGELLDPLSLLPLPLSLSWPRSVAVVHRAAPVGSAWAPVWAGREAGCLP